MTDESVCSGGVTERKTQREKWDTYSQACGFFDFFFSFED